MGYSTAQAKRLNQNARWKKKSRCITPTTTTVQRPSVDFQSRTKRCTVTRSPLEVQQPSSYTSVDIFPSCSCLLLVVGYPPAKLFHFRPKVPTQPVRRRSTGLGSVTWYPAISADEFELPLRPAQSPRSVLVPQGRMAPRATIGTLAVSVSATQVLPWPQSMSIQTKGRGRYAADSRLSFITDTSTSLGSPFSDTQSWADLHGRSGMSFGLPEFIVVDTRIGTQ